VIIIVALVFGGFGFVLGFIYMGTRTWAYLVKRDKSIREHRIANIQPVSPSPNDMNPQMREWMRIQAQEVVRLEQEERLEELQEVTDREEWIKNGRPEKPILSPAKKDEIKSRFEILDIDKKIP
jgi:hypothetical protein